jgi:hypothetical protein
LVEETLKLERGLPAGSPFDLQNKKFGGKGVGGQRVGPRKSVIIGAVGIGALLTFLFVALAKDKS